MPCGLAIPWVRFQPWWSHQKNFCLQETCQVDMILHWKLKDLSSTLCNSATLQHGKTTFSPCLYFIVAYTLPLPCLQPISSLKKGKTCCQRVVPSIVKTLVSSGYCGCNEATASTKKSLMSYLSLAPWMVFFHITVLNHFQEVLVLGSPHINLEHPG